MNKVYWKRCRNPEQWVCDFCNNESPPNGCGHIEEWGTEGMNMWHYGDKAICCICISLIQRIKEN